MADSKLKLAFVGCGGIARAHWHGIQNYAPRIEVTAVVDVDETAAKEIWQCGWRSSLQVT